MSIILRVKKSMGDSLKYKYDSLICRKGGKVGKRIYSVGKLETGSDTWLRYFSLVWRPSYFPERRNHLAVHSALFFSKCSYIGESFGDFDKSSL
jgi:hypothetical protein